MPSERVLLVSDVHLDEWKDDLPGQYQQKHQAFLDFLSWVAQMGKEGKIGRFVIAGDLIDVPQKDRSPLLPTYDDVYAGLNGIIAAGVKFGYAIGNHDSGMVGLSLDLTNPEICVGYPYILVKSGASEFVVEHGHLYDPWLWDYVRQLGTAMWTDAAGPNGVHVLSLAGGQAAHVPSDAAEKSAVDIDQLWQTRLTDAKLSDQYVLALTGALLKDLSDEYPDVTSPAADGTLLQARNDLRAQLQQTAPTAGGPFALASSALGAPPGPPLVEKLLQASYSGPHWRRAAQQRLPALSQELGKTFAGIIMGHTHYSDEFQWNDTGGQPCWYVNSGSWRYDSADLVIVEGPVFQRLKRNWQDPLPPL